MLRKEQFRTISIVIAVILLVAAFTVGILNISDDKLELMQVQDEYNDFKAVVDSLSENDKKLTDGKAAYDSEKKSYDKDKAAYDKAVADCDEQEVKFDEDVMSYNQKLAQYNVTKDAVSSGKSAYESGKAQLDEGWKTVNRGEAQLKELDKAKSYRNVYDKNGNLISSAFEASSDYKVRNKVIVKGTAPAAESQVPVSGTTVPEIPSTPTAPYQP